MSFSQFPPFSGYGEREGERTSASFLRRVQEELYAARAGEVAYPLTQYTGPAGTTIGLDRATFEVRRFKLTADLTAKGNAAAIRLTFNNTTNALEANGETFTVYDAIGSGTGTIAKSGEYGLCAWHPDNARWELLPGSTSSSPSSSVSDFFPARLDSRTFTVDTSFDLLSILTPFSPDSASSWQYGWSEVEWLHQGAPATVKSGGRSGYPAPFADVATVTEGDGSTREVQTVRVYGPPFVAGTWDYGGAAGLAFDISAASLETALETALGLGVGVTGSMSAGFTITWDANGNRTQLTADVSGLIPSSAAWPAYELNDWKARIGAIVWMRRGYFSTAAALTITKTATGDNTSTATAWSMYISDAVAGTYTLTLDGYTTSAISYGAVGSTIKSALETASGLTLSSFSGSGTSGSPWTFSVAGGNYADHTLSGDIGNIIDGSDYRFGLTLDSCSWDGVPGYDSAATMNVVTIDSSGCLIAVQPDAC